MAKLTLNKDEREMTEKANLYAQMSNSLRAQAMDSALHRKWAREEGVRD